MAARPEVPRRLFAYSLGLLRRTRVRRILELAGHDVRLGLPGPEDAVAVWGRTPRAGRGERVAAARGVPVLRLEDAFLRSLRPGRAGDPPIGLIVDPFGVHYDPGTPSLIERILSEGITDSNLIAQAEEGIARLKTLDLSKYNIHDPSHPVPAPGFVLVADQTRGDAAIHAGGAGPASFAAMLAAARSENPGARIVIKTHPETALGLRPGHFGPQDLAPGDVLLAAPVSPWRLLGAAAAVYTVSSQLGFEAILAGHRPRVFGAPFYAGWGLSGDARALPRRGRPQTPATLFAAAMLRAPLWYDPCRDRLCRFDEAVDQLEAEVRAFREDRRGHVAAGMRLWKRPRLQAVFGGSRRLVFRDDPAAAARLAARSGRDLLVWAGKAPAEPAAPGVTLRRVEDGFLRSRGLGARLVPPLSLVADDLGIHYDPRRPSRLEALVAAPLPPGGAARAARLIERLVAGGVTKYNLRGGVPPLPAGHRVLVPGQVEDDASILTQAGAVRSNRALLAAVRAARPRAVIVYKPHPDVEAGLRAGAIPAAEAAALADVVVAGGDPAALIAVVDEVWTISSLLGFEALLRGKPVTCLGVPFYAGWGLTEDRGPVPDRRRARPDLVALAHAALIAYPRYFDPLSGRPCPPEVAVERLATGAIPRASAATRALARLQGALASRAGLWR